MRIYIYDCGERYADRWEVVVRTEDAAHVWRMSDNATSGSGICYYAGRDKGNFSPTAPMAHKVPIGVVRQVANLVRGWGTSIDDYLTLAAIHAELDGREWSSDTLETIARLVQATGRDVRDAGEVDA